MNSRRTGLAGTTLALALFVGGYALTAGDSGLRWIAWGGFGLLVASTLLVYLWPTQDDSPSATDGRSVSSDSISGSVVQTGDQAIAQSGERNVIVESGGIYTEVSNTHEEDDRIFIDLTPGELATLYRDRFEIDADLMVEKYLGKWLRVRVKVHDLHLRSEIVEGSLGTVLGLMALDQEDEIVSGIVAEKDRERFKVLRPDAEIDIVGRLVRVGDTGVDLEEVGLEGSPHPAPSSTPSNEERAKS